MNALITESVDRQHSNYVPPRHGQSATADVAKFLALLPRIQVIQSTKQSGTCTSKTCRPLAFSQQPIAACRISKDRGGR